MRFQPILLLSFCLYAFSIQASEPFRVVFYNVENFFDTINEPGKNDSDFLPQSKRHWNSKKYYTKLNQIAKVLSAVGEWQTPALIGLCEVENETVVNDLTQRSPIRKQQYRFVMTDSRDERGIDVALLYQRDQFRLLSHASYRIRFPSPEKRSRDILHVCGQVKSGDTLDVFVCHYPSRRGGEKASEPYRICASDCLKQKVDSVIGIRQSPAVLIMGDFNDEPSSHSLYHTLCAKPFQEIDDSTRLCNLFFPFEKKQYKGSYKYRGYWNLLDQMIVSTHLLQPGARFGILPDRAGIYEADFLFTEDKTQGGRRPKRSFYGMKYEAGFSDHLPIYADFYVSLAD